MASRCVTELKDKFIYLFIYLFQSNETVFYLPYWLLVSVVRPSSGHPCFKFNVWIA